MCVARGRLADGTFREPIGKDDDGDLAGATGRMEEMKGKKSSVASALTGGGGVATATRPIRTIVFACDAGMGSSAMGASVLRRKIRAAGREDVTVVNKAISTLTDDVDLVVTHRDLTERARQRTPSAVHVSVDDFMASPRYDEVVELVTQDGGAGESAAPAEPAPSVGAPTEPAPSPTVPAEDQPGPQDVAAAPSSAGTLLARESIVLEGTARTMSEAITEAGELLVAAGAVPREYVAAMHEREESVSTHMGNGLAIPHGTNEAKSLIRRTAISFVRYPRGLDWNGKDTEFVIGIAGAGDDHLEVLQTVASVFLDEEQIARLRAARSAEEVESILGGVVPA